MTQKPDSPVILPPITHEQPLPAAAPPAVVATAPAPAPAGNIPVVAKVAAAAPVAVAAPAVTTPAAGPAAAPEIVPIVQASVTTSLPEVAPVATPVAPPPGTALPHRPPGVGLDSLPPMRSLLPPRWAGASARCTLHWSGWLALVPFAAVCLFNSTATARSRGMGPGAAVWHVLATTTCGLAAAMAVAWVAWQVRGRTRVVATVAFVAALSLIGIAAASGTVARTVAQSSAIKSLRTKASADATQAVHRSDAAIDHAFDCLQADGGLSLRGVSDIAQLDRRLGLFDEVLRAVREGRESREAVQSRLQADLAAEGIPTWQRDEVMGEFRNAVQWEADRRIIDATERVLAAGRQQLRFVRQEWGRMKVNRETGQCTFQDKKSGERFKQLAAQVLAANAIQRAAVKEAVSKLTSAKPHELTPAAAAN